MLVIMKDADFGEESSEHVMRHAQKTRTTAVVTSQSCRQPQMMVIWPKWLAVGLDR